MMCKYEDKCTQACAQLICMYRVMYSYVHRQNYEFFVCIQGQKSCQELQRMQIHVISYVYNISVKTNRHRQIYISAREHSPRTARSFRALSPSSPPVAASASLCHAIHKSHMRPVLRVRQSCSRLGAARDSLVPGVHRAKKCRNTWGETSCSRAGPHPRSWRSPGRDHLGEWGAVAKGARA